MAEVLVIGGGVAGLSAAWHAGQAGLEAVIFEAQHSWGGLLDNFTCQGYRFDQGVHFAFSSNEEFRLLLEKTAYQVHRPEPYNYEQGRWLKHPVQNNLYPLPIEEKIEAIKSFISRPEQSAVVDHYQQWLDQQYGEVIAGRYPARYTEKYWTVPADHLSVEWVGNRLYRPTLDEVLYGAMTDQTPQTYYLKEMLYPQYGGFKTFLKPLAAKIKLRKDKKVIRVNTSKKFVECADGTREYYDLLASSAPLPELVKMLDDSPREVLAAADQLWATSIALVSVGFTGPRAGKHLWFYIYDRELLPARVHAPYRKAADSVPAGMSSLQFEIYFSRYKPLSGSAEELTEHVLQAIEKMQLAPRRSVAVVDFRILPYAFVVFDRGMTVRRQVVLDYIKSKGIIAVGRFGLWDYLWSDQSFLSGKALEKGLDLL
jgi:protoporphyrinogen oxidase